MNNRSLNLWLLLAIFLSGCALEQSPYADMAVSPYGPLVPFFIAFVIGFVLLVIRVILDWNSH